MSNFLLKSCFILLSISGLANSQDDNGSRCLNFIPLIEGFQTAEISEFNGSYSANIEENLIEADLLSLLDKLPDGYRTIFNLFVIEGYKHREIAEKLGISINTSKSQLILARKRLQTLITNQEKLNKNA